MSIVSLEEKILSIKKERGAAILAHYYEDGAIQDIADVIGDSLYLAQQGQKLKNPVVLLAGVVFMAESVKLLSPEKTVLVPDLNAGCSLVDQSPYEKYLNWRREHPKAIAVTYVNSSVAVKSISDVVCTSSNAEKIICAIPEDREILFGPDRNLGRYLAKRTGRKIMLWPGACEVHVLFSAQKLHHLRLQHPDALVIAHPECDDAVLDQAQVIGSTSKLLDEVTNNKKFKTFIVATEDGIFHQMQKQRPDAVLVQAPAEGSCACNQCPYMKMNTLEKIYQALLTNGPQVDVKSQFQKDAKLALDRMMQITANEGTTWPQEFVH